MVVKCTLLVVLVFVGCTTGRKVSRNIRENESGFPTYSQFFEPVLTVEQLEKSHEHASSTAFRRSITSSIHDYGIDIYNALGRDVNANDNIAISPLSLYVALGMITAGTAGNSRMQAMRTMKAAGMEDVHIQIKHLLTALMASDEETDADIKIANKVFVDRSMRLYKYYKSILRLDYLSTPKKVDFAAFPEKSRGKMNQFAAKQTNKLIRQLVPKGTVDSFTKMFAINALYLKTGWQETFNSPRRPMQPFQYGVGKTVRVPMMLMRSGPCYHYFDRATLVTTLRLKLNGGISMIIMMPHTPGDFEKLQLRNKNVTKDFINKVYDERYNPASCSVTMPKFKVEYSVPDLIQVHRRMGLTDIFSSSADFSNMTPMADIFVKDVRHKTSLTVNEYGVEAAAATSYGVAFRMIPTSVLINKSFMFVIRHDDTGTNLFMGRIVKPS